MKLNPLYYWRMWRVKRILRKMAPPRLKELEGILKPYLSAIASLELPPRGELGSEANMIRVLLIMKALHEAKEKYEATQSKPE